MITGKTHIIVHLAFPATHLRTPEFFNPRCKTLGIDAVLMPWEVSPENLSSVWDGLRKVSNLAGVIITIPHKEAAAVLCDTLDAEAQAMQVCNVAQRDQKGHFHGAMFDGIGFVAGMRQQGINLDGKSALLVGAGGAATAIAHALAGSGIRELIISNRTLAKAQNLANEVGARFPDIAVRAGDADADGKDLIVNGTSLGLHDSDPLPLSLEGLSPEAIVAEVIMNPDETELLKQAQQKGAQTHRGVHMISSQVDLLIDHLLTHSPK